MDYRTITSGKARRSPGPPDCPGKDISQLLLVTARPVIQVFWTVVVAATVVYSLWSVQPRQYTVISITVVAYLAVVFGNRFFPYRKYRPFAFLALMCSCLVLISCVVHLTGGRESMLSFLFFIVPIFAASYFSYPGTVLVAALTALARYIPYFGTDAGGLVLFSLLLSGFAYLVTGVLACYIFEGEKVYARESLEYRRLLELALDKERDISLIYNVSRRFSYAVDLDTVLKTTVALARKMLSCEGSLVFLIENGAPRLKAALGTIPFLDMSSVVLPSVEPWVERLLSGNNVTADNASLSWLPLPPGQVRHYSLGAVPLFSGAEVLGYLICYTGASRGLKEGHLDLLGTLASQASVAMEKARLYTNTMDEKTKLETILSTLRDGLMVTDSRGALIQSNPVSCRILGLERFDDGVNLLEILLPAVSSSDLGPYTPEDAVRAALEGHTVFGELVLSTEPPVHTQAQFIPLKDQLGKVSGMVLFMHDITDLKRIEEMKSNFVSNVSHELRTPLTSISGFVRLLLAGRAGPLTRQQSEYLEVVREQASSLTAMIEGLLDLARLQAGKVTADMTAVSIATVFAEAAGDLYDAAAAGDIEIRTSFPSGLPPVDADPAKMAQVFSNILGNAVKFTDPGGTVEVSALDRGSMVQVRISDNGVGIPPGALPHIFDRFFQARSGETADRTGFGLGLAICREIVEIHGGNIWAESDEGRGSTFYFTLPVHAADGGTAGAGQPK